MLKITRAKALVMPAQTNKKTGKIKLDGWGHPLQTIYLRDIDKIAVTDYQIKFCRDLELAFQLETHWFKMIGLGGKLPRIANDPVPYTIQEHIAEIRDHYNKKHEPTYSFINRQAWIVFELEKHIGPDVVKEYGICVESFKNSTEHALQKFYDQVAPQPKESLFV